MLVLALISYGHRYGSSSWQPQPELQLQHRFPEKEGSSGRTP